jgi:hypothetical protein
VRDDEQVVFSIAHRLRLYTIGAWDHLHRDCQRPTAARLTEFQHRGAGTDAERRAAQWLAGEARSARRDAVLETFWCRPNWALAYAWHTRLALVGSLILVFHAALGAGLVLVALASIVIDSATGHSIGRRLTREHASQNVVSRPRQAARDPDLGECVALTGRSSPPRADSRDSVTVGDHPVTLIVTGNHDAGRTGLAYRDRWRATAARRRRRPGVARLIPGWRGGW